MFEEMKASIYGTNQNRELANQQEDPAELLQKLSSIRQSIE